MYTSCEVMDTRCARARHVRSRSRGAHTSSHNTLATPPPPHTEGLRFSREKLLLVSSAVGVGCRRIRGRCVRDHYANYYCPRVGDDVLKRFQREIILPKFPGLRHSASAFVINGFHRESVNTLCKHTTHTHTHTHTPRVLS